MCIRPYYEYANSSTSFLTRVSGSINSVNKVACQVDGSIGDSTFQPRLCEYHYAAIPTMWSNRISYILLKSDREFARKTLQRWHVWISPYPSLHASYLPPLLFPFPAQFRRPLDGMMIPPLSSVGWRISGEIEFKLPMVQSLLYTWENKLDIIQKRCCVSESSEQLFPHTPPSLPKSRKQ